MRTEGTAAKGRARATKAQLAAQLRDLQRLHALSVRLSSHVELSQLLQEVLSAVCELQSAQMGLLLLYDATLGTFQVGASISLQDAHVTRLLHLPTDAGACGRAVAERRAVTVDDITTDASLPEEAELGRAAGYRAVCCVPLQARTGQVIGLIATYFVEPSAPSPEQLQLVELYGGQAAEFIENARHFQELREASQLKDEFLATLSHEIRTPLNAVLGWTRLLRTTGTEAVDGKTLRALEAIERNSRVQAQLVEDLLDISRIVTGKLRLSFAPVDLAGVVEAALDTVRPAAENKRVAIVPLLAADVTIFGDADRLQQIVWNLLANAVRFTPAEGTVTVRLERSATSAVVTVTDTGIGISADFLPHVFDRFRQDERVAVQARKGLGLGLAIVRHLAEAHGGSVEAYSAGRDLGATFTVTLPLGTRGAAVAEPAAPESMAAAPNLSGRHILVVEDDPDTRDLLAIGLEAFGARTTAVASGVEALSALKTHAYDALVADIGMEDMNGYALIRAVRALADSSGRRLPALALTVYAHAKDREEALAAGFDSHLSKPVEPERVAAMLERMLGETRRSSDDQP